MDKYMEERCIGRGSYGCAYLATEVKTGKQYVVKKIPIELMTDKEKKQAFAEVELLSRLDNEYVVQYKENFVEGTVLHLVMEYCDGGDLTARIKEMKDSNGGYFPPDVVLTWFVQMAVAIKYLHERHILHRDLKTSNIFLTRRNIVKLGDFGIARTLESTMDHAKTVVGTPYYMSPEVCESKPYSYASDVWALGCVLYEVCALKHAFDAPNILMLIVKIIQHEVSAMQMSAIGTPDMQAADSVDETDLCDGTRSNIKNGGQWTDLVPIDGTVAFDYLSSSFQQDQVATGIRPPTLVQTSPKMMAGVAGKARGGGDRMCWVESAGSDEVDEVLEGPISPTPCDDELIKPNYETAYSEECFDSIHIDYVKVVVKPKSFVYPLSRRKSPGVAISLSSLSPSSSIGEEDDIGREVIESADDMDGGPYTSMSECDAEENFYSDDSDFDNEDLTLDTSGEVDLGVAGGVVLSPTALPTRGQSPPFVEHGYSDDFDDTEAEVIEYDNDDDFATHNGSSSSSSDDGDDEGGDDARTGAVCGNERRGLVESYSYDDDDDFLQPATPSKPPTAHPSLTGDLPLPPMASVVAVGHR
ncbi:hypothetical protein DYB32_007313 [Aphanomyces invadans]|uniref:non-specific serine/threonine protein kinase n=1 Tax=Aphanomyces invadans TaxID=157072 RepID=A0A3R6Y4V9_9STRA|nr:hypothetical protein DYB32_007313 [Aphanomyces invadans]